MEEHVYLIYVGNKFIGELSGDEAAGNAYIDAEKLAEDFGLTAKLVDKETGIDLAETINGLFTQMTKQ